MKTEFELRRRRYRCVWGTERCCIQDAHLPRIDVIKRRERQPLLGSPVIRNEHCVEIMARSQNPNGGGAGGREGRGVHSSATDDEEEVDEENSVCYATADVVVLLVSVVLVVVLAPVIV